MGFAVLNPFYGLVPQIVAISNCPILFNACNNYRLKPLTVGILKG